MRFWLFCLFTVFIISGCAVKPEDIHPDYLHDSPRYTIEGRQGYVQHRHIRFGPYRAEVRQSVQNPSRVEISGFQLDDLWQQVSVEVHDKNDQSVSLHYKQACDLNLSSLIGQGIVKVARFSGSIHVKDNLWQVRDPFRLRYGKQWFSISEDAYSHQGRQ